MNDHSEKEKAFYLALFFGLPFAIAAAFKFTDWMGWPTLLVGGWAWLAACIAICERRRS